MEWILAQKCSSGNHVVIPITKILVIDLMVDLGRVMFIIVAMHFHVNNDIRMPYADVVLYSLMYLPTIDGAVQLCTLTESNVVDLRRTP